MRSKRARPKPRSESAWMSVKAKEKGDPLHRPSFFPLLRLSSPPPRRAPRPLPFPFLSCALRLFPVPFFSSPPKAARRSGRNSPTIAAFVHDRRHCGAKASPPPKKKSEVPPQSRPLPSNGRQQAVDNSAATSQMKNPMRRGARRKAEGRAVGDFGFAPTPRPAPPATAAA